MVVNSRDHIDHCLPSILSIQHYIIQYGAISNIKWDSQFLAEVHWSLVLSVDVDPIINYTRLPGGAIKFQEISRISRV